MRKQNILCHTEELVRPTYEKDVLLLYDTDELLSPMNEIDVLWLCHMDEMLSRPYEITTVVMPYGGVSKSSV